MQSIGHLQETWKQEATSWFDNIENQCVQQIRNAKMLAVFSADEKASKTIIGSFLSQFAFMFKGLDEQMRQTLPSMSSMMQVPNSFPTLKEPTQVAEPHQDYYSHNYPSTQTFSNNMSLAAHT